MTHASGDAMRTFVYGFYFYRIAGEKDGELKRNAHTAFLLTSCFSLTININNTFTHSLSLQSPPHSSPPLLPVAGQPQLWRTSPCSRGSGSRWPSCWRRGDPATSRPSSCPGCPAGRPPTQVGTAPSAAALEDAARPPHC